jgi:hypothetical protein
LAFALQTTQASSLVYGVTVSPVPVGSGPALGANVVLPTVSSTFTAPDYSGTLFSTIYNNDSSNPYGLGDLTFTYLIQMNSSTVDPVSTFTVSSFANYLTDARETTSLPTDIVPSSVVQTAPSGSVVRYRFDGALLGAGTTSALLVVYSDAFNWANTQAGLLDGVGSSANSVAPAPLVTTPEPSTTILTGLGLMGLLIVRHWKKGQSQTTI